jgi:DNA polymerase-3 subunit delta'
VSFKLLSEKPPAIDLLQRSLARGRLAHAYLFIGGDLAGLELAASALARTVNCEGPIRAKSSGAAVDSCDKCLSCRKIAGETHSDIQWVRPESKLRVIQVDQMRELIQTINLKPAEGKYKVAMIVAADRLNEQAANAFLKTLEEPPPCSVFVLLTTEPQRIRETILSRCLRLTFGGDGTAGLDESLVAWVAGFAEAVANEPGSLLGRYRLLGRLLARLAEFKADIEARLSARSPLERYDDADPKLREKWEDELAAAIEAEYRRQRAGLLLGIQWLLRDVWLMKTLNGRELMRLPQFIPTTEKIASRITGRDAAENLRIMEQLQRYLSTNMQEALTLEVGLLKLKF